jgi:hypothetical protein
VDHSLSRADVFRWLEQDTPGVFGVRNASAWKSFASRTGLAYVNGKWQVKDAEVSAA